MALNDINFQEGEGQDFLLELPNVVYTGELGDFLVEDEGSQYSISEIPEVVNTGGGNIFIMSE